MNLANQSHRADADANGDDAEPHDLSNPDKAPVTDATLEEAEHILADYVGQFQRSPKPALASKQ